MRFALFWRLGGAMGWPPSEVGAASLWQFQAACVGWQVANGAKEALADDDVAAISALLPEE